MSGEMSAVTSDVTNAEKKDEDEEATTKEQKADEESPVSEAPSEEKRIEEEQSKRALAPVFDRLIEVNLSLVQAVGRLVKVSYVMVLAQLLLLAVVTYRVLFH